MRYTEQITITTGLVTRERKRITIQLYMELIILTHFSQLASPF